MKWKTLCGIAVVVVMLIGVSGNVRGDLRAVRQLGTSAERSPGTILRGTAGETSPTMPGAGEMPGENSPGRFCSNSAQYTFAYVVRVDVSSFSAKGCFVQMKTFDNKRFQLSVFDGSTSYNSEMLCGILAQAMANNHLLSIGYLANLEGYSDHAAAQACSVQDMAKTDKAGYDAAQAQYNTLSPAW